MKFRLKYFLSHLLISSIIALLSLLLIFKIWYPAPLDKALDVGHIIILLIGIDVTLGPLLTLILAKKGKKGLKFDLVIIATLQLSALFYGLYSIEQGRPVWIAFDSSRFELVQEHMVSRQANETFADAYATDSMFSPRWVSSRPPKDSQEQSEWLMTELSTGVSPAMRPTLYIPIEDSMDNILKAKQPLTNLEKYNMADTLKKVLSAYPQADSFLPLRTSKLSMTVLLDSKDRSILAIVNLRPW